MNLLDNIKSAVSIAQNLKDPRLIEHLMNLQTALLELQNRINKLEKENEDLKTKIAIKENLVVENGVYYSIIEDKKDGPFCTRCWDAEKKLIRLQVNSRNWFAKCPQCQSGFDLRKSMDDFSVAETKYDIFNT